MQFFCLSLITHQSFRCVASMGSKLKCSLGGIGSRSIISTHGGELRTCSLSDHLVLATLSPLLQANYGFGLTGVNYPLFGCSVYQPISADLAHK